jgi:hypothetical protein
MYWAITAFRNVIATSQRSAQARSDGLVHHGSIGCLNRNGGGEREEPT